MSTETRTLRLTINGKPAVRAVAEYQLHIDIMSHDGKEVILAGGVKIMTSNGWVGVDHTIEEVAALWDAAAPDAAIPMVQRTSTDGGVPDEGLNLTLFEAAGPWLPDFVDSEGTVYWERGLRYLGADAGGEK
jgi:hypothetical protein